MLKSLLLSLTMVFSFGASALDFSKPVISPTSLLETAPAAINFRVGENADYKLSTGFLPGTMKMLVREETDRGYWIEQNIDLLIQKQNVEIHLDKNTGEIIEMRVNGQPQDMPEDDSQIVDQREDTVTVPAGTFDCMYIKTKNSKDEEAQAWVNPQQVSVFGLVKQVANAQGQTITIELTAFEK